MTRQTAVLTSLVALALLLAGCGDTPPMGTVSGVVTLDGQPLPDVEVQFLPDPEQGTRGANANCYTDAQGRFTLRTERHGKDGALVGTHRVVFVDVAALLPTPGGPLWLPGDQGDGALKGAPRPPAKPNKNRIPPMYTDPYQTPYSSVEVKAGEQSLNFELKSGKKGR